MSIFNSLAINPFIKNTLTLISGTAIAQVVAVLFQLVTRRLYSPELFGAYSVVMSLVGVLIVAGALRYNTVIVLPKKNKDAMQLVFISVLLSAIVSMLTLLVIVYFKSNISEYIGLDENWSYLLYLIPAFVFLFNTYECFDQYLLRHNRYSNISINKGVRRISEGIAQVSGSSAIPNMGLILGDLIGHIVNNVSALVQLRKTDFFKYKFNPTLAKELLRKYINFPKQNLIPSVLNAISRVFPILIINRLFSEETTGYFSLTHLSLALPIALVGDAMAKVTLRNLSVLKNKEQKVSGEIYRNIVIATSLSLIGGGIVWLVGVDLLRFLFGEQGEIAGLYAKIMIFSYAAKFVYMVVTRLFIALQKLKPLSYFQLLYFAVLSVISFIDFNTVSDFLIVLTAIDAGMYSVIIAIAIYTARTYDKNLDQNYAPQ